MITGLSNWKVGVYLAAIFAAGGISGYFVAGKVEKQQAIKALDSKQITKDITVTFRDRCHARLNLTPEQAKRIDDIIERFSARMNAAQEENRTCLRQIRDERNRKILAELAPTQKEAFEQMEKERKEFWRSKENGHGKGPGPERGDRDKADRGSNNGAVSNSSGVTDIAPDSLELKKQHAPP
jgi:ribosomal protein L20